MVATIFREYPSMSLARVLQLAAVSQALCLAANFWHVNGCNQASWASTLHGTNANADAKSESREWLDNQVCCCPILEKCRYQ